VKQGGGQNISKQQEHDYLRDTLTSIYKECIFCNIRTQFTCVKCGYCYSCHWKKEELDKVESESDDSLIVQKIPQPTEIRAEQPSAGQMVMDVYGQEIEPICNYRTCNHRFSEHGHKCKCRHAVNYATGASISPLSKIEVI
jgi:hypothetical protein